MLNYQDENNKNIENRFIEDVYNIRQILLKSIVIEIEQDNVQEV
jgi:hypothetical protein